MKKNILITGLPKSGKSTLLKAVIAFAPRKRGFVTHEVCLDDKRVGFEIETHTGSRYQLASVDTPTSLQVGKYYVQKKALLQAINDVQTIEDVDLLYLDEVGQMQLYADNFMQLVHTYLDAMPPCIMTVSSVCESVDITAILGRDDNSILVSITKENREEKLLFVQTLLKKIAKAQRYIADPTRYTVVSRTGIHMRTDHGVRELGYIEGTWECSCDFFAKQRICSHTIALEGYIDRHGKLRSGAA